MNAGFCVVLAIVSAFAGFLFVSSLLGDPVTAVPGATPTVAAGGAGAAAGPGAEEPTAAGGAGAAAGPGAEEPTDVEPVLGQPVPGVSGSQSPSAEDLRAELLATGGVVGEVPFTGPGTLIAMTGERPPPDPARKPFMIFVRVEEDIGIDPEVFTEAVFAILNDERGWGGVDSVSFGQASSAGAARLTLTIASPATTKVLCKHVPTGGYTSCGIVGHVVINAARWAGNAQAFLDAGGSDVEYRNYVLNHEIGHHLNHWHVHCPGPGALAPVMLQQTLRLDGCVPNGWPNP